MKSKTKPTRHGMVASVPKFPPSSQTRRDTQATESPKDARRSISLVKSEATTDPQKVAELSVLKAQALKMLQQAGGVKDPEVAARILDQVMRTQAPWAFGEAREGFKCSVEMMLELNPGTITEAMLCTQMIGVHCAALSYLYKAASGGEQSESYVARSTRLMRLFHEQAEVVARLKGKTVQQKVTVEHVHVHKGGQAIVGAVDSAKLKQGEGGGDEKHTKTP